MDQYTGTSICFIGGDVRNLVSKIKLSVYIFSICK